MAAKDRAAKDKAMAAHLKKHGVRRTSTMCPFSSRKNGAHSVGLNNLVGHLQTCKAGLGGARY